MLHFVNTSVNQVSVICNNSDYTDAKKYGYGGVPLRKLKYLSEREVRKEVVQGKQQHIFIEMIIQMGMRELRIMNKDNKGDTSCVTRSLIGGRTWP